MRTIKLERKSIIACLISILLCQASYATVNINKINSTRYNSNESRNIQRNILKNTEMYIASEKAENKKRDQEENDA